jgi:hypothetical protein
MSVIREIRGRSVPPPGIDTKDVELDLEIHALDRPDTGFLLISSSSDPEFTGDTWHETLELALRQAEHDFGVRATEWTLIPD